MQVGLQDELVGLDALAWAHMEREGPPVEGDGADADVHEDLRAVVGGDREGMARRGHLGHRAGDGRVHAAVLGDHGEACAQASAGKRLVGNLRHVDELPVGRAREPWGRKARRGGALLAAGLAQACLRLGHQAFCCLNLADGHRELLDAELYEAADGLRVGGKLAADTRGDAVSAACVGAHPDEPEHRLVMGLEVAVEPARLAVEGQGVLRQVVRADAEEGCLSGELVGAQGRRGRLHHDAQLGHLEGHALALKLLGCCLDLLPYGVDLPRGGDHGEHDLEVARDAGPQQGP